MGYVLTNSCDQRVSLFATMPFRLKAAAMEVKQLTQAPEPLIYASIMSAVAVAVQRVAVVKTPWGSTVPLCLSFCTVGNSGERKTSVDGLVMKGIRATEDAMLAQYEQSQIDYSVQLELWQDRKNAIKAEHKQKRRDGTFSDSDSQGLIDHEHAKPNQPMLNRLTCKRATPEALQSLLADGHGAIGVISDEAEGLFRNGVFSDLSLLNDGWSGSDITIDRKSTESYRIKKPKITLCLMLQESVFKKLLNRPAHDPRGNGFLSRSLIAWPISTQGTRFDNGGLAEHPALERFNERIQEIVGIGDAVRASDRGASERVLELSEEAQQALRDYANWIEAQIARGGFLNGFGDVASKVAENTVRLAALYHFFEGNDGPIPLATLNAAKQVTWLYVEEFVRIFREKSAAEKLQEDCQACLEAIHCLMRQGLSVTNVLIKDIAPQFAKGKYLDYLLDCLQAQGWIRLCKKSRATYIYLPLQQLTVGALGVITSI